MLLNDIVRNSPFLPTVEGGLDTLGVAEDASDGTPTRKSFDEHQYDGGASIQPNDRFRGRSVNILHHVGRDKA